VEDATVKKATRLEIALKIPTDDDDVALNLHFDGFPTSSIEENSSDAISPAAEGIDLFESGQEALEEYDDAHVVVI
jgi:hypothetical protein